MRSRRLLAAFIDFFVGIQLSSVAVAIVTLGKLEVTPLSAATYFGSFAIYSIFKDIVLRDASVGKRIFKLRVMKTDGTRLTFPDVLKRTLPLILGPVEIILMIINDRRIGDVWAKTFVERKL